jgi:uncharacterized protein (TIGR02246 family)
MVGGSLEARLQRVEDEHAIAALVQAYSFAMDNHDLAWALDLYTPDGRFCSADGMTDARGQEALAADYSARFARLTFNFHYTHDRTVQFESADRASGMVSAHAEVAHRGEAKVAAMRYHDCYQRCADGRWRFAERCLHFFYYLAASDYLTALARRDRQRAYGGAREADLPEGAWKKGSETGLAKPARG